MSNEKESRESAADSLPQTNDGSLLQEKAAAAPKPEDEHIPGFLKSIWKYSSSRELGMLLIAVVSAMGAGSARPLMTLVFGSLVNDFNSVDAIPSAELTASVNHNVLFYVYLFVAQFLLTYMYAVLFSIISTNITGRLRFAYLQSILGQDMAYLESCTAGAVASDISNTANMVQSGLSEMLGMTIQGTTELLVAFIIAFIESWKLTLVMMTAVVTLFAGSILLSRLDTRLQSKVSDIYKSASSMVEEALGNIQSVTVLGAQPKLLQRYLVYLERAKRLSFRRSTVVGTQFSFAYFVLLGAYALAYWYGIRLFLEGQIDKGGKVVVVILCVNMATNSLQQLIPAVGMVIKAKVAIKTLMKTIARRSNMGRRSRITSVPKECQGRIVMSNVGFAYPSRPNVDVLKSMSLVFEPNQSTALVGPSGGGKSTIMDLLDRWIQPNQGNIFLDGTDIQDLDMKWYRSQIRVVEQEPRLFNDSIFRNVVDGLSLKGTDQGVLPQEFIRALVRQACREANIHSFIESLPEGYDTKVGEKGNRLSGGQKQRIAIARAIISNPRILLLDEATSALDDHSERLVQEALKNISKFRTTITIAHKLSTIQNADRIVVIDQGRLIEQGTHEDLLWLNGLYKSLFRSQYITNALNNLSPDGQPKYRPEEAIQKYLMTQEGLIVSQEGKLKTTYGESMPAEEAPLTADGGSLLRCLWIIFRSQKQLRILLVPGLIACIAAGAVYPVQAVLFAKVVTAFTLQENALSHAANFWGLMFFVLAIEVFVAFVVLGITFSLMAAYNSFFYRSKYFDAMLNQDLSFFSQGSASAGVLTARLSSHTNQLQALVSTTLGLLLVIIVDLVSSLTLALVVGWKLALVTMFGSLPPIILAGYLRVNIETKVENISEDFINESARYASEVVDMIKTVAALALEDKVLKRFRERLGHITAKSSTRAARNMLLFAFAQSARLLGMALAFWYGGMLLARHEISAYAYFVIFVAIVAGGEAAGEFFAGSNNLVKAKSAAIQILGLLSRRPAINHAPGTPLPPTPVDPSIPKLALENVNFTYPNSGSVPTLNLTSLSIQRHRTTALVGRSGAGKSTILALLARLYDPTAGAVVFDGVPLNRIAADDYRSAVALVTQDIHLFQGTLRENILLGVPEYDPTAERLDPNIEVRMEDACRRASLHEWIQSLPEGYGTLCGQKGRSFSGGQRQRIALARALVRGCDVIILDEATSALDAENERKVYEGLAEMGRDGRKITVVVVAHRLATVRKADEIIVLGEGGVVKEKGGHEELIARQEAYWEMYREQDVERHREGFWI